MHEIITLQLGQKSNYLATHFWNTQESYFTYAPDQESLIDHDIHFRPGIGANGTETFTPRTLIYDLKGGFGSMRKINALYEVEEPVAPQGLWNGPAIVQRQTAIQQSEYQRSLDEGLPPPQLTTQSVKYWSDFNRVFYHPRSIVQLNDFELNSSLMPFENWSVGEELFNSLDKEHDLLDRDLRYFAEEADQLQGIQLMAGSDDAWGGFAARYVDRIRDEFGKTSVLFWGSEDNANNIPRGKNLMQLCNTARSITEIASQASLFIPMTIPSSTLPPYVMLDPRSQWHISAILSSAMESASLPSRLKLQDSARQTLDQLSNSLNMNGNQTIAKIRMSVEQGSAVNGNSHANLVGASEITDLRFPHGNDHKDDLNSNDGLEPRDLDIDFFPVDSGERPRVRHTKRRHVFGQAEISRGSTAGEQTQVIGEDEGYDRARRRAAGLPIIKRTRIPLSFPLLDSFPRIFPQKTTTPTSTALDTSLSTDTSVAERLKTLQHVISRAIGVDERETLSNTLGELAEAYEEGWDSGSDEDDDY